MKTDLPLDLKHRPRNFDDLVGQDHIAAQFIGAMKRKKISQRYLIYGPTGSGKTTIARLIAQYVNCLDTKSIHPCGKCDSCKIFKKNEDHPDVAEVNFAADRGIDDMRVLLDNAFFAPQTNFRIFILDEMHMATPQAKQAFLKRLEEPPPSTIWILATTNPEKLPDAIRGRCTKYAIKPVSVKDDTELLKDICKKEGEKVDKKVLKKIAELVRGEPRSSLIALESVLNYTQSGKKVKNVGELVEKALLEILEIPPYTLVLKYLTSVYMGVASGALRTLEMVGDVDFFIRLVIEYHTQATFIQLSDKLKNPTYWGFYKDLKDYKYKVKHFRMSLLLEEFVKLSSEIRNYLVDGKYLAVSTTLKCINIVKGDQ